MMGIIMSAKAFKHELKHYYQNESLLNQYKPLAKKYQIDLCLFSFRQIQKNLKMVEALVYSHKEDNVIRTMVPLPPVNIVRNTSYVVDRGVINRFKILHHQGIHFINFPLYRQADKLQNYELLNSLAQLKSHVPPTRRLTFEDLNTFMQQYSKVIIKPIYGSKGRGITIIEKGRVEYQICQTSFGKALYSNSEPAQKRLSVPASEIKQFYNETFQRPASFLVQEWIPFKEFNGRPFDIRAVMQKNGDNRWQLTSRVARVAHEKGQITNLNQGGEMLSLSKLPLKNYHGHVHRFCLEIAKTFANLYPWSAEMGIDLAIDKNGKLWYIETNFCPEKVRWETIYKIPFEYGCYLYTRGF